MAALSPIQHCLEQLYQVDAGHNVDDFLITDPSVAAALDRGANPREVDEKLLVREDEDGLRISLYLAPELLARLAEDDPLERLHPGNLASFCTALEGVSHFLYLVIHAGLGRGVNQMELEMQAEVDKFVTITALMGAQRSARLTPGLHPWLFEHARFDAALSSGELAHYRAANEFAAKYCADLERRYLTPWHGGIAALLDELRSFYRLPLSDKLRRIESRRS